MNASADVSVIIPCFNSEKTLLRALNSVLDQTLLPREIILIDDGSTDTTLEILREFSKTHTEKLIITVNALPQNRGAAYARNTGWELATSKYIAFLDADDTWNPDKIQIQYTWMIEHTFCDLSGHKCTYPKSKIQQKSKFIKIHPHRILLSNPFPTPSIMLKKAIHCRFNTKLSHLEDQLLWSTIAFNKYSCYRHESSLAFVHKNPYGQGGLSKSILQMELGELKMYKILHTEKFISLSQKIFYYLFSFLKFARRLFIHKIQKSST